MQSAAEIADSSLQGEAVCGSVCCLIMHVCSSIHAMIIGDLKNILSLLSLPLFITHHLNLSSLPPLICPAFLSMKQKAEAVINLLTCHGSVMKYMKQ